MKTKTIKDLAKMSTPYPFEKFAAMIEHPWDGLASYCHPDNKGSLGFIERMSSKHEAIQRYVKTKQIIITSFKSAFFSH